MDLAACTSIHSLHFLLLPMHFVDLNRIKMKLQTRMSFALALVILSITSIQIGGDACRVQSEGLKRYTRKNIEQFLDKDVLESIYWDEEPLSSRILGKALGLEISLVTTSFQLERLNSTGNATDDANVPSELAEPTGFLRDIFVSCSTDRDRSYSLAINLEIDNPFKQLEFQHHSAPGSNSRFKIQLPDSTFLVQLRQRIRYDECLDVMYVQLAPNIRYLLECVDCTPEEQSNLDKIFTKRMSQFDAELDPMLSEKMLLGLQVLLNQQRLDLDLYLDNSQ